MEGDTVTTETKTWTDDTRALGVAPIVATEVYIVQDGKIKSVTWTISDESLAVLMAAFAGDRWRGFPHLCFGGGAWGPGNRGWSWLGAATPPSASSVIGQAREAA